jgi:hypothetical protein
MRGEMIDHNNPPRCRLKRTGTLKMSHAILFGPRRAHGRCQYLPCRDLKSGAQRLSPMTTVFKFHTLCQPRLQRPCGMSAFVGLNAGLPLRPHDMHPVGMQVLGFVRQVAYRLDVGVKWLRVPSPVMSEPLPRPRRLSVRGLVKNVRCGAGKWWEPCPA